MKIEICLPIKNEEVILEDNILAIINFIKEADFPYKLSLLAVVNDSSDNSLAIVKQIAEDNKDFLRYIELSEGGKGRAIKSAWGSSEADILAFMDIDLVVPLSYLSKLFEEIIENNYELVLGSRYLAGSSIKRSWARRLTSRSYIYLSRKILGHRYNDLQCGFKAIRRSAYLKLAPYLENNDWFLDTELIIFAELKELRIKEIPVCWEEKKNKLRKSNIKILKDSYFFIENTLALRKRIYLFKKNK